MPTKNDDARTTNGLCPRCGGALPREPGRCALSRTDDETLVCSQCGEQEGVAWYAASEKVGHSVPLSKAGWKN